MNELVKMNLLILAGESVLDIFIKISTMILKNGLTCQIIMKEDERDHYLQEKPKK